MLGFPVGYLTPAFVLQMGKLRQRVTISDSPKITVRQEQKREQKAAPPFPGECFPHWSHCPSILSLSSTPHWILVEKSNSLNPDLSLSPCPTLGRLSPVRGEHHGELNEATEAVPAFSSRIPAQAAKLTPSPGVTCSCRAPRSLDGGY